MADIFIEREHALGLGEARQIDFTRVEQAQAEFGMAFTYVEVDIGNFVSLRRSGANGTLAVAQNRLNCSTRML